MDRYLYENSIKKFLSRLDTSTLTKVLDQLDHLGYADDFSLRRYVEEKDLKPFMKEGHIKILLKNWKAPNPEAGPQTRDVAGPSGACARSAPEYQDRDKLEARRLAKNEWKLKSTVVKLEGKAEIFELQMTEEAANKDAGLYHLSFGHAYPPKETKVVLLVGQTGAGKSALIDAFVNYLLGVEFEDNYRFRVPKIETELNQAHSQTQHITAYTLYHQTTFPDEFPYNLMIVDTPGFGDNQGIEADKKIERKLKLFFTSEEPGGIGVLHAVGFVVKSSETFLSAALKYVLNSMLAPFGIDIRENIFLLTTFTDGPKPSCLAIVKEEKLPYTEYFTFNSSILFDDIFKLPESKRIQYKSSWSMNSYHEFLQHVAKATPRRLTQSNEVLTEREKLETRLCALQEKLEYKLSTSASLYKELELLDRHKNEIATTKDLIASLRYDPTIETKKQKKIKKPLKSGEFALNCMKCEMTCHHPCRNFGSEQWRCKFIDSSTRNCLICDGRCAATEHELMQEVLVTTEEICGVNIRKVKARYEEVCSKELSTENVILEIIKNVEIAETEVVTLVDDIRQSMNRLHEIALKADLSYTIAEYIDIMITSAKRHRNADWQDRVEHLRAVRERALQINNIAEAKGIPEPFVILKKEILEMKAGREAGRGGIINSIMSMGSWVERKNKVVHDLLKSVSLGVQMSQSINN